MTTTLKLYKGSAEFPGSEEQAAEIANYKYSATRMGNIPTITATLEWPTCLDSEWSDEVFVLFRGERYLLKNTPSSSFSNASLLYKHQIEFISERSILAEVYLRDVMNANGSTDFTFSGDIHMFADIVNSSLAASGIRQEYGYKVVVDDNISSESKLFTSSNKFVYDALKEAYELYEVPFYFAGKTIHFGNYQTFIDSPIEYGSKSSALSINKNNKNNRIVNRITGFGSDRNIALYYPNPTPKGFLTLESTSTTATFEVMDMLDFCASMDLDSPIEYNRVDGNIINFAYSEDGETFTDLTEYTEIPAKFQQNAWVKINFSVANAGQVFIGLKLINGGYSDTYISSCYVSSTLTGPEDLYDTQLVDDYIHCGRLDVAQYTLTVKIQYPYIGVSTYDTRIVPSFRVFDYWKYVGRDEVKQLSDFSIRKVSGVISPGDTLTQKSTRRIDVQNRLMPSIYRDSNGENRWYNAVSGEFTHDDGSRIIFDNPYDTHNPREYVLECEDIYPTIVGITNSRGQRIDVFADIAFDMQDDNGVYPEDHENAGEYIHPYFFVKMRKTDGSNGFNLFDCAIESEPMKISFTSGNVAACEFEIGVDEKTNKNPVQVTSSGELLRDASGNVVCKGIPQESQQNTQNNEVWIALKKEDSTMGVLMPDKSQSITPTVDDTFVILGITLPEAYIRNAEDRLDKEIIKYMYENNSSRFSYNVKMSSIFLAESGEVYDSLNENSMVKLIYDSKNEGDFIVESYSYSAKNDAVLPEISLTLNNDIKLAKPKSKTLAEVIKTNKLVASKNISEDNKLKNKSRRIVSKFEARLSETKQEITDRLLSEIATNKGLQDLKNEELYGASASAAIKVFKQQLAEIEAEFASIEEMVHAMPVKPAEWLLYLDAYKVYSAKLKEVLKLKNPDSINVSGFDEARATYIDTRDRLKKAINYQDAKASQVALYSKEIVSVESQRESILQEWANLLGKLWVLADSTGTELVDKDGVALYVYDSDGETTTEYERYSASASAYISMLRSMIDNLDFNENDEYKQLRKDYYREYSLIKTMISQGRVNRFDSIDVTLGGYNDKIGLSQKLSAIAIVTANKTEISSAAGKTIMRSSLLDTYEGISVEMEMYAIAYPSLEGPPVEYKEYEMAATRFLSLIKNIIKTTTTKTWTVTSDFVKLRTAYQDTRDYLREYELINQ